VRRHLPELLENLALQSLLFAVLQGRRLLVELPLFPLADDAFFLNLPLEPLESAFESLVLTDFDVGD
jgi:hypothetical protein